jgi:hypothetical protein
MNLITLPNEQTLPFTVNLFRMNPSGGLREEPVKK